MTEDDRQRVPKAKGPAGLIILDKPRGVTSARALYRVRRITGQRKSGHAGTLDPAATGVLILCLGRATKLVERLMNLTKVYVADARLDVVSDSHDADGVLEDVAVEHVPTAEAVTAMLARFLGDIEQVPPRISAVKIDGQPAYKRARRGEMVELKARPARIDWIEVLAYDWPVVRFRMQCGRGTYVRSLIRDVGRGLGTGGCLTGLVRERVGCFSLDNAWTMEALESADDPLTSIIPIDEAVRMIESV